MQTSAERVILVNAPLDVMCDVVTFFEHVKELECQHIRAPQQVCLCNVLLLTHTIQFASFECYSSLEGRTSLLLHLPAIANSYIVVHHLKQQNIASLYTSDHIHGCVCVMFCIPMRTMCFNSLDEADMDQTPAVVGQQRTITNSYACVVLYFVWSLCSTEMPPC